jgi:NAD(P)-dependent dehydrogenase (short-subunit alcohol dehydrogenase family)
MSAYVSSKHALVGLTKTAALEYAAQGVRVNVLCPGGFRTPMSDRIYQGDFSGIVANTPMGRIAPAEEIAPMIVWLCSDEASFVTGAAYQVDGGRMAGPVLAA